MHFSFKGARIVRAAAKPGAGFRFALAVFACSAGALAGLCAGCESSDEKEIVLTDEEKKSAVELAKVADAAWAEFTRIRGKEGPEESPVEMSAELEAAHGRAVKALGEFVDSFRGVEGRDLALFRLGEALTVSSELDGAHEAYEEMIRKYPGSNLFTAALERELKIALRLLGGEKTAILGLKIFGGSSLAAEILDMILEFSPYAAWAPKALMLLGMLKFEDEEYDEALVHFDTLVRRFPDGEERVYAEFRAARCFYRKFRGLDYDITPLEEALERYRAFIELHQDNPSETVQALVGQDLGEGKKPRYTGAREMKAGIEGLLAEKNYRVGRWYDSKGRDEAALCYYRFVVREFPGTAWAGKAAERIGEIGGK